jgi:hypothetical protein
MFRRDPNETRGLNMFRLRCHGLTSFIHGDVSAGVERLCQWSLHAYLNFSQGFSEAMVLRVVHGNGDYRWFLKSEGVR